MHRWVSRARGASGKREGRLFTERRKEQRGPWSEGGRGLPLARRGHRPGGPPPRERRSTECGFGAESAGILTVSNHPNPRRSMIWSGVMRSSPVRRCPNRDDARACVRKGAWALEQPKNREVEGEPHRTERGCVAAWRPAGPCWGPATKARPARAGRWCPKRRKKWQHRSRRAWDGSSGPGARRKAQCFSVQTAGGGRCSFGDRRPSAGGDLTGGDGPASPMSIVQAPSSPREPTRTDARCVGVRAGRQRER